MRCTNISKTLVRQDFSVLSILKVFYVGLLGVFYVGLLGVFRNYFVKQDLKHLYPFKFSAINYIINFLHDPM